MCKQRIFNLTQHDPSTEQLEAGVQNLPLQAQHPIRIFRRFSLGDVYHE